MILKAVVKLNQIIPSARMIVFDSLFFYDGINKVMSIYKHSSKVITPTCPIVSTQLNLILQNY